MTEKTWLAEDSEHIMYDHGIKKRKIKFVFSSPDGRTFDNYPEASRHCKEINFEAHYTSNTLNFIENDWPQRVSYELLAAWLFDNKDEVLDFLSDDKERV